MKTALSGHTSEETAYVVEDYPYGFRLRCKIRYWLEYKRGKGFRFVSQTSNPKLENKVWNKPKASTFIRFGAVMLRDEDNGYIEWTGVSEYSDLPQLTAFLKDYGSTMPGDAVEALKYFIGGKIDYDEAKSRGKVTCQMTVKEYGSITDPDFGLKLVKPPTVTTEVLAPDHTDRERFAMRVQLMNT